MSGPTEAPSPRIHRGLLLAVFAVTLAIAGWALHRAWALHDTLILDESGVHAQVRLFLEGRFELFRWPGQPYPASAMFPGFQGVLAAVAAVTGLDSPSALRLCTFGFSLGWAAVAYQVARQFHAPDVALLRALQCYLLPIAFPYNFLMYTDVFSLLITFAAFWALLRERWILGGLLAFFSLLVRQNNVIFLLFLGGFTLVQAHGFRPRLEDALRHLRRCWLLVAGMIAFAVFVLVHGRVGLDAPNQQPTTLSLGNLAISLVTAGILFFPLHLARRPAVFGWLKTHRVATALLLLATLAVGLSYVPGHRWNLIPEMLRNRLIAVLTQDHAWRLLFAAAMAAVVLSVKVTPLVRPAAVLIYPFWFLVLVPVLLVEPRYYMSAFALFLLLRERDDPRQEITLCAWLAFLSVWLHQGLTAGRFLL